MSFSQRHTKKVWKPNLQTKTMVVDGKKVTLKVSTQALRTLKKKGISLTDSTQILVNAEAGRLKGLGAIIGTTNPENAKTNIRYAEKGPLPADVVGKIRAAFAAQDPQRKWTGQT